MRSFSLIKTNVGLTTNIKIIVDSNYSLYLESIDSDPDLSDIKYKKFAFSSSSYYDELLPAFYTGSPQSISSAVSSSINNQLSIDTAMSVQYKNDSDVMFTTFDNQFDDIYQMGCRNIIDNKNYSEEYECFAPLYIGNDGFPTNFIILRIDGPGLINLTPSNFRSEIINNFKCVTIFDLTKSTNLGQWIQTNFTNNTNFPVAPFYMDFRNLEFSYWNGIDYEIGGYASVPFFLDTTLEYENTFYDFESFIYNGYKNNKVVFPNIINFSFLFNDTPATPTSIRTWSLNRYMGFYLDSMEISSILNPYVLPALQPDVTILGGNILSSPSNINNPFINDWSTINAPYIEVNGNFYQVQQYTRTYEPNYYKVQLSKNVYSDEIVPLQQNFYKVISDVNLMGLTFGSINNNSVIINSDNSIAFTNGNDLLPDYNTADLWIIDINNINHVINKESNIYYIQSDYGFSMSSDEIIYYTNGTYSSTTIDISITSTFNPILFNVYRCKFTDIKDFDTSIINTEYSKFEYDLPLQLTHTDETKMYSTNYSSTSTPKDLDDFIINGQVVNIPVSSEYTANGETFRIQNNGTKILDLSPIWRKNPTRVKWGYQNSISSNDYPYLLNNSFLGEDYNRTSNPFNPIPDRTERNLDYFYSINSSTSSYSYHSLHVENSIGNSIDTNFNFELNKYLGTESDYFSYFFNKKSTFNNGSVLFNTQKYSIFEVGDDIIPNSTLFRGLKFNLYDVNNIQSDNTNINSINLESQNTYQGYKFSILLSKNIYKVLPLGTNLSIGGLTSSSNSLSWYIIDNWTHNISYEIGDIVSYYDILYIALTQSNISDPNQNPSINNSWLPETWSPTYSVFWSPTYNYSNNNFVYNNGEYYYYNTSNGTYSFWNPFEQYSYNDVVLYSNNMWISTTFSNIYQPNSSKNWISGTNSIYYWAQTSNYSNAWPIVEIWSPSNTYTSNSIIKPNNVINTPGQPYCVYNNILYQLNITISNSSGDVPGISPVWVRIYSILQDPNYIYSATNNPIISLNNRYYKCLSNTNGSTLENGICIYVNNIFNNILINIYINDNTLLDLNNTDRDSIYNDLYSNITSSNFINAINDISNTYGFSDYIQYVIINKDGSFNTYNFNNISQLSCIIMCQFPDQFFSRIQSINITPSTLSNSQIKPLFTLNNGTIVTLDMLNYYNGDPLATIIDRVSDDQPIIPNYSGLQNNIYNTLFRYSGYYSPIFYTIPLFEAPGYTSSVVGNYIFDTSLTDFGIMKERVISKINSSGNILKLSNVANINSIYPMLDEFGYTFTDYFIFKSTWDYGYYIECSVPIQTIVLASNNNILKP